MPDTAYYLKPKPVNFTEPTVGKKRSYQSAKPSLKKTVPMSFNSSFVDCWMGGCGKAVGKVSVITITQRHIYHTTRQVHL